MRRKVRISATDWVVLTVVEVKLNSGDRAFVLAGKAGNIGNIGDVTVYFPDDLPQVLYGNQMYIIGQQPKIHKSTAEIYEEGLRRLGDRLKKVNRRRGRMYEDEDGEGGCNVIARVELAKPNTVKVHLYGEKKSREMIPVLAGKPGQERGKGYVILSDAAAIPGIQAEFPNSKYTVWFEGHSALEFSASDIKIADQTNPDQLETETRRMLTGGDLSKRI